MSHPPEVVPKSPNSLHLEPLLYIVYIYLRILSLTHFILQLCLPLSKLLSSVNKTICLTHLWLLFTTQHRTKINNYLYINIEYEPIKELLSIHLIFLIIYYMPRTRYREMNKTWFMHLQELTVQLSIRSKPKPQSSRIHTITFIGTHP